MENILKITALVTFTAILVVLTWGFTIKVSPNSASAADQVSIGGWVYRVDDTERGVTCYTTGSSGIDCLPTIK